MAATLRVNARAGKRFETDTARTKFIAKRRSRLLRTIFALALLPGSACYPFFEVDCVSKDPYCKPDAGWLLYQQLLKPNIPLFQAAGGQGLVARSLDGDIWTKNIPENSLTTQALFGGIASDQNGNWVATGASGAIIVSSDSQTWRLATDSGVSATVLRGVSYSSALDRWLTVGNGTNIFRSDGRDSWTNATVAVGPTPYYNSAFGNGTFVAVGNGGGIMRSFDGDVWSVAADSGITGQSLFGVAAGLIPVANP